MNDNPHMEKWDPLRSKIYGHWQKYNPKMLAQFQRENRVTEELEKTAQQMSDLLYQLTVVDKMDYQAAWEMVIDQFLWPEET